jgi:hypothetical protein
MKTSKLPKASTNILRLALLGMGLLALALCVNFIFLIADGEADYRSPVWVLPLLAVVPFFIALRAAFKLLGFIDKNKAFSQASVRALQQIKNCAFIVSGLFTLGSPYVLYVADRDDAPGLFAMNLVLIGASFVVATATAVFHRLLQNVVDIKSEHDLTV